jgi:ribonuclease HII
MAVLVGIDEAGFGPILGPLIISSSTFKLSRGASSAALAAPAISELESDLWQVLVKSVGKKRQRLAGRLLIADSKKAYNKTMGIKHLERTVLTVLRCLDKEPATLSELMEMLCPNRPEKLSDYPWYKDAQNYAVSADTADRAIAAAVLSNDLASNGIELNEVRSCCLDVAYYNKMVATVRNKASVLFTATSQLIQTAFERFGREDLHIIIDRQGGRMHYRNNLQRMFPEMSLRIVRESPAVSSYELKVNGGGMNVHFVVGADDKYLPVSLASMVSKYLREILVGCINRYFTGFGPNIKPTAGYWEDGLRFIEDLKTKLPHIRFDQNQLIRCR